VADLHREHRRLGDSGSVAPAISTDGRYVAFDWGSTNLVPADMNRKGDVFVRAVSP
jgi:hypothetical protein